MPGPRLRQVALVATDLAAVAAQLQATFGWGDPYADPGVGEFGLTNAVFAAGDTFVEVVAPVRAGTTAGRYLERRGGDSGYMAIFQVPDLAAARQRVAELGIRVVWTADLADMAGTHLHPRDVPGAIVSLDWADPPGSWRWAGPSWTAGAPAAGPGGLVGLRVAAADPAAMAQRWADVLGVDGVPPAAGDGSVAVELVDAAQTLRFERLTPGAGEGITAVSIATPGVHLPPDGVLIGGTRFFAAPA